SEPVRVPEALAESEPVRGPEVAAERDSGRVSGGVVEMEAEREPVVVDASEPVRVPEALAESEPVRGPEVAAERDSGRGSGGVVEMEAEREPVVVDASEPVRVPEGRIDGSVDGSIDDVETAAKNLVLSAENVFAKLRSAGKEQPSSQSQTNIRLSDTTTAVPPDTTTDSALLLRKQAAAGAARAMKKVLVEEQGELLDAIRISGGAAMTKRTRQPRHHSYEQAALTALKEQASALGASSDLDLAPALDNIAQIALEPMNRRLLTISNDALGEEELSDAVRALYREVRSRHLNDAALAASVTVDGLVQIAKARRAAANGLDAEPKVRWVVDPNGACGAECADNALAGDVHAGNEFPTGDRYPPAHPRCTCRLTVT
ncbi:MAG: hypothetical protein OXB90_06075, partial [Acidimicrobiaceae bacterium]|nr:hypothetical protein [Acidimicrobiaceae bacterium]